MSHILIDGYNLIRQSRTLSAIEARNFEQGRLSLIKKLAAYKKLKSHIITVIFDATHTLNLSVEEDRMAGVRILYSEGGQTADEVMIAMARKLRDQAIVVSSDNEILHAAKQAGCAILESDEFERKLNEALMYEQTGRIETEEAKHQPLNKRWITMKKGPSKRLPKAKRRALARLKEL